MATPLAANVLAAQNSVANAQKQLTALSAAIALVSTNLVADGSSSTADLSLVFKSNVDALSNILTYYQNYFAVVNGNATS